MSKIVPTVGRIVLFTLGAWQAEQINKRYADASRCLEYHRVKSNGVMLHLGNAVAEGDVFPAVVVRTYGDTPDCRINLKVMLDGTGDFWVTSVTVEPEREDGAHTPGFYHWMTYQKGQAAKAEALEAQLKQSV